MAQLIDVYIDPTKFDKSKKDARGCYKVTISVGEREDNYGQNVSSWHKVDKGETKTYLFSGRTFWSDKGEHIPSKNNTPTTNEVKGVSYPTQSQKAIPIPKDEDLPF